MNNLSEAERFMSIAIQLASFCPDIIQVDLYNEEHYGQPYMDEMNENYATMIANMK